MAEILVMAIGKEMSGDPYIDRHRWQAGDVVAIHEDGHKWGRGETDDPQFRIIKLPKIPRIQLTTLLAPDIGYAEKEAEKASRVLRRRAYNLDVEALDVERGKSEEVSLEKVLPTIAAKPRLVDPAEVGDRESVEIIGIGVRG